MIRLSMIEKENELTTQDSLHKMNARTASDTKRNEQQTRTRGCLGQKKNEQAVQDTKRNEQEQKASRLSKIPGYKKERGDHLEYIIGTRNRSVYKKNEQEKRKRMLCNIK